MRHTLARVIMIRTRDALSGVGLGRNAPGPMTARFTVANTKMTTRKLATSTETRFMAPPPKDYFTW